METPSQNDATSLHVEDSPANSCFILRLPDELLIEISFQVMLLYADTAGARTACKPPDPYRPQRPLPPIYCYEWIAVSHICYRWRQAVLNHPFIWTTIALPNNMTWVNTLLERSRRFPLVVVADVVSASDRELPGQDLMLQVLYERSIPELHIVLDPPKVYDLLAAFSSELLRTSAKHLEVLDIQVRFDVNAPHGPLPTIPTGSFPRLRHLTFRSERTDGARWEWLPEPMLMKEFLAPSLTTLHLLHLQTPISSHVCLLILAILPRLEDLELGEVLEPFFHNAHAPTRTLSLEDLVVLQHLKKISFKGTSGEWTVLASNGWGWDEGVHAADVLQHLIFPSSAEIFFSMGKEDSFGSSLFSFIRKVLRDTLTSVKWSSNVIGRPRPLATRCHITISRISGDPFTCQFVVELFTGGASRSGRVSRNEIDTHSAHTQRRAVQHTTNRRIIQTQFRVEYCDFASCISAVLGTFKSLLPRVTIFHFKGNFIDTILPELDQYDVDHDHVTDPIWESVVEVMPQIRELVVTGWHSAEFIRWLGRTSLVSEKSILPHLQTLEVDGSDPKWKNWGIDLSNLLRDAEDRNKPLVIEELEADDESTNGPREALARQVIMALTAWSMQFKKLRKLPLLTVSSANVADKKDLDRLRACCFIDQVEILYATK